jgi:hypothetical protein
MTWERVWNHIINPDTMEVRWVDQYNRAHAPEEKLDPSVWYMLKCHCERDGCLGKFLQRWPENKSGTPKQIKEDWDNYFRFNGVAQ